MKLFKDKIIASNLQLRIISIFTQIVIIYTIGNIFNKEDQGYYYILNSIAGISVFFELGFGMIIMQHAARLFSNHNNKNKLSENILLISLLKYVNQFYLITCLVYMFGVFVYSNNYFSYEQLIRIKYALFLLSIASAIKIYFDGNVSFFDGCGKMDFTTKLRIGQTFLFLMLFLILLKINIVSNIYIYPISLLTSYVFVILFVQMSTRTFEYRVFFKKIIKTNNRIKKHSWFRKIIRHQVKISVSWISGYFISQIPLLFIFKYLGAELGGKYGFTINLLTSITNLSLIFIHTINPKLAYFTSTKQFASLNKLFIERLKIALASNTALIIVFWLSKIILIDNYRLFFNERFLNNYSIFILSIMSYLGILTSSISCYVRSNREEPLMFNSIITAIIVFSCSYYIIRNSTIEEYILFSSIIILIVEAPWFLSIYFKYKNKIYIN